MSLDYCIPMFTLTDLILVGLLTFFSALGFLWGLIQAIGALLGLFFGFWAALNLYQPAGDWLAANLIHQPIVSRVLAFILIFLIVSRLVGLLFWLVNKIFKLISLIPFLGSINRLGGLILGLAEGAIILGVAIYLLVHLAPNYTWLIAPLNNSQVAHYLVWLAQFLTNFLS